MQSVVLGTRPSWGGLLSVVRTKHHPGRSLGLSNSSTVCPVCTLSSDTQLAAKSCSTTVNSHPPESCRQRQRQKDKRRKRREKEQWCLLFQVATPFMNHTRRGIVYWTVSDCTAFKMLKTCTYETCRTHIPVGFFLGKSEFLPSIVFKWVQPFPCEDEANTILSFWSRERQEEWHAEL